MDDDNTQLKALLKFLKVVEDLKATYRTGWLRVFKDSKQKAYFNPESVASHSWGVALLVALFAPPDLDRDKSILMALVHDIGESVIGDIPTYAEVKEDLKHELEKNAFQYLRILLSDFDKTLADSIYNLWLEYEENKTPESRFVKEMDRFDCLRQAMSYELMFRGRKLEMDILEEFQGVEKMIGSQRVKNLANVLSKDRGDLQVKQKRRLPIIFIIGDHVVGERVATHVSSTFDLQHISMDRLARDRVRDPTYHGVIKTCLDNNSSLPDYLACEMLDDKIQKIQDANPRQWIIISGFLDNMEQLECFERHIHHSNLGIWVEDCSKIDGSAASDLASNDMASWKPSIEEYKGVLKKFLVSFSELKVPGQFLDDMAATLVQELCKAYENRTPSLS